jgi:hypothetical protein
MKPLFAPHKVKKKSECMQIRRRKPASCLNNCMVALEQFHIFQRLFQVKCTGGGVAQRKGLQIPKTVSSNLTLCSKQTEGNAAGLVLRLALKTRFSEMGWGSTPLPSANNKSS